MMFAYDDKLLAAVEAAPQSVEDAIRTMQAIDAICSDGDGLDAAPPEDPLAAASEAARASCVLIAHATYGLLLSS